MRVRCSLRRICASCRIVRRGSNVYVICPSNARHKQKQKNFSTSASSAAVGPAEDGETSTEAYVEQMHAALDAVYTPAGIEAARKNKAAASSAVAVARAADGTLL